MKEKSMFRCKSTDLLLHFPKTFLFPARPVQTNAAAHYDERWEIIQAGEAGHNFTETLKPAIT